MKVSKANSTKDNLCDYCSYNIPTCEPKHIIFGDGIGNDNIIECNQFEGLNISNNYPVKTINKGEK